MRSCHASGWCRKLALVLTLAPLLLAWQAGIADESLATQMASKARFIPLPAIAATPVGDAGPQGDAVTLPHLWRAGPLPMPAHAEYRLLVQVPRDGVQAMWALGFTQVSERARVTLNGQLLHESGRALDGQPVFRTQPLLLDVPPALLQPGANDLVLRVSHGSWRRAGLSSLVYGPREAVLTAHQRYRLWHLDLPYAANLFAAASAVLLLTVWLLRRREVALGLFGALYLLGSLRNAGDYSGALVPAALWDGFQFVSVVWNGNLLLLFALRFSGWRWPRRERAVWVWGLLATGAAGVALAARITDLGGLRQLGYPVALLLTVAAAWVMLGHVARTRQAGDRVMAAGVVVNLLGSAHDLLLLRGALDATAEFWLPWLMPLLLCAFALILLQRVLVALREAEALGPVLEQRVAQRTRELATANEAKSRFLATASHDLRQPLATIGLLAGLLRERVDTAEQRTLVDKLQAAADGLSDLLKGLLDLSRLEGGTVRPRIETVALGPLLQAVQAAEAPQARLRGIELRVVPSRCLVRTDRTLLDSLLRNLVGNAVRYTPRGRVLVGVRQRGGEALLQVIDTGPGIAPEERSRIFEAFYRGGAAVDAAPGFGLGLAIVRRAADLLGHRLELVSTPGRGTCVQLTLPLAAAPLPARGESVLTAADRRLLQGAFVVLLEDDPALREALAALLRHSGCQVLEAAAADEALQALAGHLRNPDLLLCDMRLGGGADGLQAVDALRSAVAEPVPALILTGETDAATLARLAAGGPPVLHKPVPPGELLAAVAAGLRRVGVQARPHTG